MREFQILQGDVLDILATLPAESVQCVVTSPPYWGLRDYGLPPSVWGGDSGCEHGWGEWQESHDEREGTIHGKTRTTDRFYGDESRRFNGNHQKHSAGSFCRHCGAWRGCFGLEPTPELYTEHAVRIFREVRRVLKPDGVLFLNLGDSYAGSRGNTAEKPGVDNKAAGGDNGIPTGIRKDVSGLKPKDLVGIPWRVAFALQSDGWWLRSDIIWAKPNPMPESVRDRPTKAHEYVFLMTKSAKYFWNADAVRETSICERLRGPASHPCPDTNGNNGLSRREGNGYRNIRSVWTIATKPFPQSHFAVFPPEIPQRCIAAGSREGDTVLDPFGGAGTTGMVALRMGRRAILVDLSPEYVEMARERIIQDAPMFNREVA